MSGKDPVRAGAALAACHTARTAHRGRRRCGIRPDQPAGIDPGHGHRNAVERGLPVPERVAADGRHAGDRAAGDGLDSRRRVRARAGSQNLYDGTQLAVDGQVVIVTVNYRLGALGFADLTAFNEPGEHRFEVECRDERRTGRTHLGAREHRRIRR